MMNFQAQEVVSDTLAQVTKATAKEENIGEWIIHHISNSNEWHLPFGIHLHLPTFEPVEIFGISFNFSISNHLVMLWIAAAIILLLFRSVKPKQQVQRGLGMFLETIVVFVRDEIAIANMGEKYGKKFTPLLVSFFLFILTANLMGLIPLFSTATGNISTTAALALITFLATQIYGMKESGILHYYTGLVPASVPGYLWPLMFVVEIMGLLAKHMALTIRLFANMIAGHIVLFALIGLIIIFKSYFVSLVSVPFGVFVSLLEILIATIQAYIFTLLSALFIGMSVKPDH
jgi:F-type H+-transporting ATPase subunit a